MFALFSCDFKSIFGNKSGDIAAFTEAIANTNPKNVVVDAVVSTAYGDLKSSITVNYKDDGSAVITYSTEKFNAIGEGAADEIKSTYAGTIVRAADGTYSGDVNNIDVSGVTAGFKVNVEAMKDYAINEAGDVLTAKVAAADTEAVLGAAYSKDVTVVISINEGVVELVDLTFEGGSVSYKYE
jgi:hypothetical protein